MPCIPAAVCCCCVLALKSCALQVVAFQQMMQIMADQFPGAFSGYKLDVVESHQRNKADTSGTAKAVVQSFAQMGVDFKEVREALQRSDVGSLSCASFRRVGAGCAPVE